MSSDEERDVLRERFADLDRAVVADGSVVQPGNPRPGYRPAPPWQRMTEQMLQFAFVDNLYELFRAMAHLPGAHLEETAIGCRHLATPFSPMFKGVWQTRVPEHDADAAIEDTVRWFSAHGAPFAFWWVDSRTTPVDLGGRLERHGWQSWELDAPGMAADLNGLDFDAMVRIPATYRQCRVENAAGLEDFRRAFVTGFGVPDWAGQAWVDATMAFGIDQAPWQCFVGYLDGEPVASNILFRAAGVASVFGVATAPHARGQGIGAAITLLPLHLAREDGYRYGVLFGSESGVPVYERIGFGHVNATISRYLWRAD